METNKGWWGSYRNILGFLLLDDEVVQLVGALREPPRHERREPDRQGILDVAHKVVGLWPGIDQKQALGALEQRLQFREADAVRLELGRPRP